MNFLTKLKGEELKFGANRKKWSKSIISSVISIIVGLIIALIIATAIGYNPLEVFTGLFSIGFQDPISLFFEFGVLAMAGFAFAFAAKAGIFNIGISGQMLAAGTMVVFVSNQFFIPNAPVIPQVAGQLITLVVAVLTGAFVALITGLIETYLKVNSVVTAIILNWIIYFLSFYLLASNHPTTAGGNVVVGSALIPDQFRFWDTTIIPSIPSLIPVIIVVFTIGIIMFILFKFTVYGHKTKSIGISSEASRFAGYNVKAIKLSAFVISGALSGILAIILYSSQRLPQIGLSMFTDSIPIEGFNGIAIALIVYNNPFGIIAISSLIGLFKTSVNGIFLNESASYINLLIGLLLLAAALNVLISELRPIVRLKSLKYGRDFFKVNQTFENNLNIVISKYRTLYKNQKLEIFSSSGTDIQKEELWKLVKVEIEDDYQKEKMFIFETYNISKIKVWVHSIQLNINNEINKISDLDSRKKLKDNLEGVK